MDYASPHSREREEDVAREHAQRAEWRKSLANKDRELEVCIVRCIYFSSEVYFVLARTCFVIGLRDSEPRRNVTKMS